MKSMGMAKTIKITVDTHEMLRKRGEKGETFDHIIRKLILDEVASSSSSRKKEKK
jgi:predicted CopG family antitoxin